MTGQFKRQAARYLTCVGFCVAVAVLVPVTAALEWCWPRKK